MKLRLSFVLAMCLAQAGFAVTVTNVAQVRMYCLSLHVEPGVGDLFGLHYTLAFFSGTPTAPNGELYPLLEEGHPTHATAFVLEAPDLPEPLVGQIEVDAPENINEDGDEIPDLYEVEQGVPSTKTTGTWRSEVAQGTIEATWQRAPGERQGTVTFALRSDEFGQLPTFTHRFDVIQYNGTLRYTPSADPVRGTVELKRVMLDTSTLSGPLVLTREPTNRFKQFEIGESTWKNQDGKDVPVSVGDIEDYEGAPMDYFGAFSL